jgi:hypothetical protein
MKRVLVLTSRQGDGAALRDLLAEAGHDVEVARDLNSAAYKPPHPDVIVADTEPWTLEGRALIERAQLGFGAPKLIMLSAWAPQGQPSPGVLFLCKPVALRDLESAISSPFTAAHYGRAGSITKKVSAMASADDSNRAS